MVCRSVIYLVTNKINGKRYVGVTRFPEKRWKDHVRKAYRNPESYFHNSIAKYRADNFSVEHIATCVSPEYGSFVEREVIKDLKPEYNQTNGGEHTVGKRVPQEVVARIRAANVGKKRTLEQREVMSISKKNKYANDPEYKQRILDSLEKARQTPGAREKQRAAASLSGKNRVYTPEIRLNMSLAQKGRTQPAERVARMAKTKQKPLICTTTGRKFECCDDAAEHFKVSTSSLYKVLVGARKSVHGLSFSYI